MEGRGAAAVRPRRGSGRAGRKAAGGRDCWGATHRFADDPTHGTGHRSSHAKAPVVQDIHGNLEAGARSPQNVLRRDTDGIEVDLSGVGCLDAHLLLRGATGGAEGGLRYPLPPAGLSRGLFCHP